MKNDIVYSEGTKVKKISGKPFKSGLKVATIKEVTSNPDDPKHRAAYAFEEDDTVVNAELCIALDDERMKFLGHVEIGGTLYILRDKLNPVIIEASVYNVYSDTNDFDHCLAKTIFYTTKEETPKSGRLVLLDDEFEQTCIADKPIFYCVATSKHALIEQCKLWMDADMKEISSAIDNLNKKLHDIRVSKTTLEKL